MKISLVSKRRLKMAEESVNLKGKSVENIQPEEEINIEFPSNLEITLLDFYSAEMDT